MYHSGAEEAALRSTLPFQGFRQVDERKTREKQDSAIHGKKTGGTVRNIFTNGQSSLKPIREGRDSQRTSSGRLLKQTYENE
jgi:hypothetical protein